MSAKTKAKAALAYAKSIHENWFVIYTLAGAFLFVFFGIKEDSRLNNSLEALGALLAISGGFSALNNWLSVHGFIKKEIEKILFSNEMLKDNERFEKVWGQLVSVSLERHMPSLEPHLHKQFLREYLPAQGELFYKEYHQTYDVYWEDQNQGIIRIVEKCEITIHTSSSSKHQKAYSYTSSYPEGVDLECEVLALKLDGKCLLDKVNYSDHTDSGITTQKIAYRIDLEGKENYRYYRRTKRLLSLDYEPFIVLCNGWNTYRPKVTVNCHDRGLKAFFTSIGTLEEFTTIDGNNKSGHMEEQHPGLTMKSQGYTVYFTRA